MRNVDNGFPDFKSGFIAIAGAPNVGKSTLLNRILGEKISITSEKAQTTRNRILGVAHRPASQLVFLDTPGIHNAKNTLNLRIVDVALSSMGGADVILFIADLTKPDPDSELIVVNKLRKQTKPVILALNKTDLIKKSLILTAIDRWAKAYAFETIIPISAKHGDQVEELLDAMEAVLPQGPPYFPEDALTDMPERFIAAEMIREKVFRFTGQEIPYATAVTVEVFSEDVRKSLVKIRAVIHVERDSQKGIVIGKSGSKLKKIGEEARKEIERMVGTKVFLKLFVRVQKNWSRDTKALRKFGY
ncbi:GTPase Era [Desulfococcaceae bacterium HSG8]|nr:GTPase Era [Desulfococcaceae bacterium HSG8]